MQNCGFGLLAEAIFNKKTGQAVKTRKVMYKKVGTSVSLD